MGHFIANTPDSVMAHPDARSLVAMLDDATGIEEAALVSFTKAWNILLCDNDQFLRRYLVELGGLPTYSEMPRKVIEGLILNVGRLLLGKGTLETLIEFSDLISCGNTLYDSGEPLRFPDYIILDHIPNGQLLLCDESNPITTTEDYARYPSDFIYLFSGEEADNGVGEITLVVNTPFANSEAFKSWYRDVITRFIPGYTFGFTLNITFNLI